MNEIIKLVTEYEFTTVVVIVILVLLGIKGVADFVDWVRGKLYKWRSNKNEVEDKEGDMITRISSLENRVERLERHDQNQYEKLKDIDTKLDDIKKMNNQQTVVTTRSALLRLANELREQGYCRLDEYETFKGLASAYLAAGGNSVFKDKIIPEIEALDIRA